MLQLMKVHNTTTIRVNPYYDACTQHCPFLIKKDNLAYCSKYKHTLAILTYKPTNVISRAWQLFKINVRRYLDTKKAHRINRTYLKFEHVYYETLEDGNVRLYLRGLSCKHDYSTAEKLGYIVT